MTDLSNLDWLTNEQATAVRILQYTKNKFGLALMMIAEGGANPREIARTALDGTTREQDREQNPDVTDSGK